jgi:hypothetical protein
MPNQKLLQAVQVAGQRAGRAWISLCFAYAARFPATKQERTDSLSYSKQCSFDRIVGVQSVVRPATIQNLLNRGPYIDSVNARPLVPRWELVSEITFRPFLFMTPCLSCSGPRMARPDSRV